MNEQASALLELVLDPFADVVALRRAAVNSPSTDTAWDACTSCCDPGYDGHDPWEDPAPAEAP